MFHIMQNHLLRTIGALLTGICIVVGLLLMPSYLETSAKSARVEPNLGFEKIDDFENIASGGLHGQNGWKTTGNVNVISDPHQAGNKVLQTSGHEENAYKALPAQIDNGNTGTLYFRMMRDGGVDGFAGASGQNAPNTWDAYEAQFGTNTENASSFRVRDGRSFKDVGQFEANAWHCVWLVIDNQNNSYEAYAQGGSYGNRTKLAVNGQSVFTFRNGGNNSLATFLVRTGYATSKSIFVDDIFVDVDSVNFNKPAGRCDDGDPPVPPTDGFAKIENFEGVASGKLHGKNGWNATENVNVVSDSFQNRNKVLQTSGHEENAYKALTAQIENGHTGTLYFRMMRDGGVDGFVGASDENSPNTWDAYEAQFGTNTESASSFRVRDGGRFKDIGQFNANSWHCVWLVINNQDNTYEAYAQGGAYNNRTKLTNGGQTTFAFRNGGNNPLKTFLVRTGFATSNSIFIDDIYIDVSSTNFDKPEGSCSPSSVDPPVADFQGEPVQGQAPLKTKFRDTSIGQIISWFWDFGDNTTSQEVNPEHTYTEPGNYTVKLSVTGPGGSYEEVKTNFVMVSPLLPAPPTADFRASPTDGEVPLRVQFSDMSTGEIHSYRWDFGDGTISNNANPVHTYLESGNYTVKLTVAGPGGADEEIKRNYIQVSAPPLEQCYQLVGQNVGTGSYPVASPDRSEGCEAGYYHEGTRISLSANPSPGYRVERWSGTDNDESTSTTNTVTMPGQGHVFKVYYVASPEPCYQLVSRVEGEGSSLEATPAQSRNCEVGYYHSGAQISLKANPSAGWEIGSWSGTDRDNLIADTNFLTMPDRDHEVTITYIQSCYLLVTQPEGSGGIPQVSPERSEGCEARHYHLGTRATLTANPLPGYKVERWSGTDDDESTSTTNTVTMPSEGHVVKVYYVASPEPCF
ncbi:MAG: PKD domain-containing protein, partial [Chloroflexota bacterium]